MNGAPLAPQHGFPLRLLVPGWYGMTSVKWLGRITAVDRPFEGYQQAHSYRLRQDEDEDGRAAVADAAAGADGSARLPGVRRRAADRAAGPCLLEGRAWSGLGEVEAASVSTTGARAGTPRSSRTTWLRVGVAAMDVPLERDGGEYELCCRARDAAGNEQPLEPSWNLGGYVNNAVQRIPVTVDGG